MNQTKVGWVTWHCLILETTGLCVTNDGIYWDSTEHRVGGRWDQDTVRVAQARVWQRMLKKMPENVSFPPASWRLAIRLCMSLPLSGLSFTIYTLGSFLWSGTWVLSLDRHRFRFRLHQWLCLTLGKFWPPEPQFLLSIRVVMAHPPECGCGASVSQS